MMPCECGLRCPHYLYGEDGDRWCFYPYVQWTCGDSASGADPGEMCYCPLVLEASPLEEMLEDTESDIRARIA